MVFRLLVPIVGSRLVPDSGFTDFSVSAFCFGLESAFERTVCTSVLKRSRRSDCRGKQDWIEEACRRYSGLLSGTRNIRFSVIFSFLHLISFKIRKLRLVSEVNLFRFNFLVAIVTF